MDNKTIKSKLGYKESHKQVEYIEKVFQDAGVKISELSFLFKLLKNIKENYSELNTPIIMFNAAYVDRIATALPCLENIENKNKYLKDLLKGTLDFMDNAPSHAKSILWELEVLTHLKPTFENIYLDEPDVVIPFDDGDIGISCKKITSEKNLQSVLSKAVSQIEKNSCEFGIVAINIDHLTPEKSILNKNTFTEVADTLYEENIKFSHRNEHHFLKYLNKNRILAVIICTNVIADVAKETPRFNNAFQWVIWTAPSLNKRHKEKITIFKKTVQ